MGLVGRSAERKVAFAGRFVAARSLPISAASASPVGSERSREMKWVSSSDFVGREPSGSLMIVMLSAKALDRRPHFVPRGGLRCSGSTRSTVKHRAGPSTVLAGAFCADSVRGCSPRRR